jgi:hypothetical protein
MALPYEMSSVPSSGWFQDPIVAKSFVMLNLYFALETSCDQFHSGATDEALVTLARIVAAVEDFNEEIDDADLAADLVIVEKLEAVMIDRGAVAPSDLRIPADPWPGD